MEKTVRTLIQKGQEELAEAGITDAAFDSKALLSFVLSIPFSKLFFHYDDVVEDCDKTRYEELIQKRISGVPLQYITNEQEFMGLSFYVDPRVLIPRLDTEILVETALEYMRNDMNMRDAMAKSGPDGADHAGKAGDTIRVLDLCCGSGAIGLSIAALMEKAQVTLTDISEGALEVTRKNAESLGVADKVVILKGDLFDAVPDAVPDGAHAVDAADAGQSESPYDQSLYDLIISNPPYIETDVIGTLDTEVKDHEPVLALDGGSDGLDIYRRILQKAPEYLTQGGCLMMEIGCDQADPIKELAAQSGRFCYIKVKKDLAGLDRVVIAKVQ